MSPFLKIALTIVFYKSLSQYFFLEEDVLRWSYGETRFLSLLQFHSTGLYRHPFIGVDPVLDEDGVRAW